MKVVRTSLWINPVYDQKMNAEAGIDLCILDVKGSAEVAWQQLGQAHVYQIAATKDDLPKPYFAHQALIERCPNLLMVSSNGAGFDTVDAHACTQAGILVVNQSGGNARSVAEHNITINNLLPGAFDTDRIRTTLKGAAEKAGKSIEEMADVRKKAIPAQRFGTAEEFGKTCAFLCSAHASYMTGQNILTDGGAYPGTY